jgi:hypothetical protein
MTIHLIFHTVIFVLFGIFTLYDVKGSNKPRKYVKLFIGIFALLIALYDILTAL